MSGGWRTAAFFAVFLLAGAVMVPWLAWPVVQSWQSRDWRPVPATVESIDLVRDGSTYAVELSYRYTVDGRDYRGDRYDFSLGSDRERDAKRAWVGDHPPGATFAAHVDPDDPANSVARRDLGKLDLALGLFPLMFVVIGTGGLVGCGVARMPRRTHFEVAVEADERRPFLPATLPLRTPRGEEFKAEAVVAGGMNTIAWPVTLISLAAVDDRADCLFEAMAYVVFPAFTLMAVVFALQAIWYGANAVVRPWPTLTVEPAAATPGGRLRVAWSALWRGDWIGSLILDLDAGAGPTSIARLSREEQAAGSIEVDLPPGPTSAVRLIARRSGSPLRVGYRLTVG